MLKRRKIEGLMAQALYETLSARDAAMLDAYFDKHPEARAEFETMRRFVEAVPSAPPPFDADLLPAVRVRIEEEAAVPPRPLWLRPALLIPSAVAVAGMFAVLSLWGPAMNRESTRPVHQTAERREDSPLSSALETARDRVAQAEYAEAYRGLAHALEHNPQAPGAGEAQMLLADIAFAHLRWYDRAYEDYECLFSEYHQAWLESPAYVRDRRDLLAEARPVEFRSLHDLDAARSNRLDPIGALERVIAAYPEQTYVRSQAAIEMAKHTIAAGAVDAEAPDALVLALHHMRTQTADPMVSAQLSYQLGELYESEYEEFDKAREAFIYASRHPALQQQARSALARLDDETER